MKPDRWHPSNWTTAELRRELEYQQVIGPQWPSPHCGHIARGSGYCADCLGAELRKREAK